MNEDVVVLDHCGNRGDRQHLVFVMIQLIPPIEKETREVTQRYAETLQEPSVDLAEDGELANFCPWRAHAPARGNRRSMKRRERLFYGPDFESHVFQPV